MTAARTSPGGHLYAVASGIPSACGLARENAHGSTTSFTVATPYPAMFAQAVSAHQWCDRYGASRIGADLETGQEQYLSLSRLNHRLPRVQTHPEVMQGTAEFHHQI